jgi:hypothetical protein
LMEIGDGVQADRREIGVPGLGAVLLALLLRWIEAFDLDGAEAHVFFRVAEIFGELTGLIERRIGGRLRKVAGLVEWLRHLAPAQILALPFHGGLHPDSVYGREAVGISSGLRLSISAPPDPRFCGNPGDGGSLQDAQEKLEAIGHGVNKVREIEIEDWHLSTSRCVL